MKRILVAIDNVWYDLTHFDHPGGSIIKMYNLKNATVVYKSLHSKIKPSQRLQMYATDLSMPIPIKPSYKWDSDFAYDVRNLNFRHSNIAPWSWWFRFILITFFWQYYEYLHMYYGNYYYSMMLGLMYALMGLCIGHDGSHGAVSNISLINQCMARYMDFIGTNSYYWFKQHIMQHHAYTNHSDFDPDTNGGEPFFVIDPDRRKKDNNALYVIWLLGYSISFNIPRIFYIKDPWELFMCVVLRIWFFYRVFYKFHIINGLITIFVTGFFLSNLFIISHNTKECTRNNENECWYKSQVEGSTTYGGAIAGFLTGGLNYQIEHHCFPRMNSMYYPIIQKQLQSVCKKHNVKYNYYSSLWKNYKDTYKFLSKNH